MFKQIFLFELKYRIKRPATWAYFGILFLFGFLTAIYGGISASEKTFANSPYVIAQTLTIVSLFGMLIASAVMGVPVYRDIEHGTQGYLFSYPVTEKGYIGGRYLGSLVILFLISLGLQTGLMIGNALGPVLGLEEADRFGPFGLSYYVQPTLLLYWPNLLFTGTIFFALVATTRKVMTTYVGSILLFIGYLLASTLVSDLEMRDLVDILDPFALNTLSNATRYWTTVEQNTLLMPFSGNVLWNRLLWVGASALIFGVTLFRFDFQRFLAVRLGKKEKTPAAAPARRPLRSLEDIPTGEKLFSGGIFFRQMLRLARLEFANIVRDPYFIAILLGGVLFLFLDGWFGSPIYGTPSLPLTYYMLEAKDGNYGLFVFIILTFYTGEVVHRDQSVKYAGISDTLPVPNWLIYGSKFLSLTLVSFLLVNIVIVCGMANQIAKGYFQFEFGKYFADLYLIEFPEYLQFVFLAFFVHILVNRKFLGHVVTIGLWVTLFAIRGIGEFDYNLALYGYLPNYVISDMNGFGHFVQPVFWFSLYWFAFGIILLVLGNLFWNRGSEDDWSMRFKTLKQRLNRSSVPALLAALAVWIGSGAFIYYNVSVLNEYRTSDQLTEASAEYEKKYSQYAGIPQPKVTDVVLTADVYPENRRASLLGTFQIVNKTSYRIDSLHLNHITPIRHAVLRTFTLDGTAPERIYHDEDYQYSIYQIPGGMAPGDTMEMVMAVDASYEGFTNSGFNREIVYNGTFFNNSLFPSFGYSPDGEISSDKDRKKHGLPIKEYSLPERDDSTGRQNLLFVDDADFVTFEATVSTSPDQIAIAPGTLQREWEENGRKYFHYKMNGKIQAFFNVSSARYEVMQDTWSNPDGSTGKVQIFHHPTHTRNLDRFMAGAKDAIAYYQREFSPYQYGQLRILEFPRYASFAQSFPNTVPYAESFGWMGDFSDPDDTDYAYYVTAHEVAHQWWAHQLVPGATRGANQLSESMAEYSALMVLREKYGDEIVQKFLRYSLDRYLRGRAGESKFEKTLLDNDDQQYVWYQKGSMVLYALQDYISEDSLHAAFSQLLKDAAFRETPPFANTTEWYSYIQRATPDSMRYFVEDSFEKIVLYENRAKTAKFRVLADSTYELTLEVESKKIYYDGQGNELSQGDAPNLIEVGVFAADSKNEQGMTQRAPLFVEKQWLTPGTHTLTFTVKDKPTKAGIDPYNKLIDRVPEDNLIDVEEE